MKAAPAVRAVPAQTGSCVDASWWRRWKCASHLSVSHRGPTGRVPVSSGAGPIFGWRLPVDSGFVEGLLGQGGHRYQCVGLVLLVHLEGFSLKKTQNVSRKHISGQQLFKYMPCKHLCIWTLCLWSLWVSAVFTLKRVQGNVLKRALACVLLFCCRRKQTPRKRLIWILKCCLNF